MEEETGPEEEVEETRAARAEAQAQQAQMEQAAQGASIAKDVSAANGGQLPEEMMG